MDHVFVSSALAADPADIFAAYCALHERCKIRAAFPAGLPVVHFDVYGSLDYINMIERRCGLVWNKTDLSVAGLLIIIYYQHRQ